MDPVPTTTEGDPAEAETAGPTKRSAADRRRAAAWLLEVWRDVTRDLAVAGLGDRRAIRDPHLLEELETAGARIVPGAAATFLARLARTEEQLDANISPELALDVLVLAWPRASAAA